MTRETSEVARKTPKKSKEKNNCKIGVNEKGSSQAHMNHPPQPSAGKSYCNQLRRFRLNNLPAGPERRPSIGSQYAML